MEGPVDDDAAIEFSRGFYDAIGAGRAIDFAYGEGCRTVDLTTPNTLFISKMLKRRSGRLRPPEKPSRSVENQTLKERLFTSNVVLIDASLDPHDSPYKQSLEGEIKKIRYMGQHPRKGKNSN